ncbi:MAG: aspartate--tRNA ligase, partial [Gemmatimonadota bacterium]|nr:aspartate--tRNA ligase [Gemmatimonadota bacterium]
MTLRTQLRTHTCGELREEHTGEEVRLAGWVQRVRDHGGMTFVDLRDRYGVVQLVVHAGEDADEGMAELVRKLRNEFVLSAAGVVTPRAPGTENADMPTGKVEVAVKEMTVVNPAPELPFQVEGAAEAGDELRLKHRYLDLRRLRLQRVFALRHRVSTEARRFLDSREFLEIETPMLVKRTPEGARDYLVPSRIQQGQFYALPQSPQLYKQILMCSGFDRYFQLARCLRDEDLRADRQPEHTQIDLEMSFVDEEDIYGLVEGLMAHLWKEALDVEVETPFPRLTHAESMEMYGSDKPDTRCGPAFFEAADLAAESTSDLFRTVAERGERMKGFRVPGGADWSRRILDELAETASGGGAKGLAWMKVDDGGNLTGGISKFFDGVSGALLGRAEARGGDLLLFVAGPEGVVHASLDLVRREVGRRR